MATIVTNPHAQRAQRTMKVLSPEDFHIKDVAHKQTVAVPNGTWP